MMSSMQTVLAKLLRRFECDLLCLLLCILVMWELLGLKIIQDAQVRQNAMQMCHTRLHPGRPLKLFWTEEWVTNIVIREARPEEVFFFVQQSQKPFRAWVIRKNGQHMTDMGTNNLALARETGLVDQDLMILIQMISSICSLVVVALEEALLPGDPKHKAAISYQQIMNLRDQSKNMWKKWNYVSLSPCNVSRIASLKHNGFKSKSGFTTLS